VSYHLQNADTDGQSSDENGLVAFGQATAASGPSRWRHWRRFPGGGDFLPRPAPMLAAARGEGQRLESSRQRANRNRWFYAERTPNPPGALSVSDLELARGPILNEPRAVAATRRSLMSRAVDFIPSLALTTANGGSPARSLVGRRVDEQSATAAGSALTSDGGESARLAVCSSVRIS